MLKTVDRMILGELRGPFIFGVALFSLLTIATVVLQDALRFISKWDLPASMFFTLVGYAMPQFIVLSIPMGVLLGTLLSVGRLNSDQEIVALRACGISLYRILMPFFLVGVFLAGLTFLSNEAVVPYCNSRLKDIKNEVISGKTGQNSMQRMSWEIYDHGELRWVLVANEVVGTTLNDVLMLYFDPVDKYSNFMVEAERAEWDSSSWTLYSLRQVMLHRGQEEDEPLVTHAEKLTLDDFNILPESLALKLKTTEDLTIRQLWLLVREMVGERGYSPRDKEILEFKTAMHFKISLPLLPVFFIIMAVPLAIMPQRSSRAMGMGLALLIVLAYYSLFILFQKMGAAGVLPPVVAAWVPNAILLGTGLTLMQRRNQN